jgi:metal-responsive CopG/Arc/MetJ family transcriptional regulator
MNKKPPGKTQKPTGVSLDDAIRGRLDRLADKEHVSRSVIIRRAVLQMMDREEAKAEGPACRPCAHSNAKGRKAC